MTTNTKSLHDLVDPRHPGICLISLVLAIGCWPWLPASAESLDSDAWEHRLAVHLWGAGLDGKTGNKFAGSEIGVEFSDIMKNFEGGFMFDYRGKRGKWGVGIDGIYLNISPSPDRPPADVDLKQWIVDATGRYEVDKGLELLAGARFVDIDVEAKLNLPVPTSDIKGDESWVDPIFGAEYRGSFHDKWPYLLHGDIGGFGVSSDLTWQLAGYVGYQPSERWIFYGGYRHLKIDYESDGSNKFFYDIAISGPLLGIGFNF